MSDIVKEYFLNKCTSMPLKVVYLINLSLASATLCNFINPSDTQSMVLYINKFKPPTYITNYVAPINMSLRFSRELEANTSELVENLKEVLMKKCHNNNLYVHY